MLVALDFLIGPSPEVVIAGREDDDSVHELIRAVRMVYAPNKVVLFRPEQKKDPPIVEVAPFTRLQRAVQGKPSCYLCTDFTCRLPFFSGDEVLSALQPVRNGHLSTRSKLRQQLIPKTLHWHTY